MLEGSKVGHPRQSAIPLAIAQHSRVRALGSKLAPCVQENRIGRIFLMTNTHTRGQVWQVDGGMLLTK